MKKWIAFPAFILVSGSLSLGQPRIESDVHQLQAGVDNNMSYCTYADPGLSGADVEWDFSDLEFEKVFTGFIGQTADTELGTEFEGTNTCLREFDSQFFFRVTENQLEQYGYASVDGRVLTRYNVPFIKMRYPFSYGDIYSGSFSGSTYYAGTETGTVRGSYTVEADAWGQLILPGDVKYANTLRVKTEKSYIAATGQSTQEVRITTYRWYNSAHRYPLLVLTRYTTDNGYKASVHYQAAYNNDAVDGIPPLEMERIVLYPNPASDHLMLEFKAIAAGTILFSIVDYNGRIVRECTCDILHAGIQSISLDQHIDGLKSSNYILRIRNGEEVIDRSFNIIK